jgi:Ca2+-transporting ATPase
MITGDAVETAMAIGRQLGLLVQATHSTSSNALASGGHGEKDTALQERHTDLSLYAKGCMTGAELDAMDDRILRERVRAISIFARTTPRHKMRIVAALQANGAVVGMTGDGGMFWATGLLCRVLRKANPRHLFLLSQ